MTMEAALSTASSRLRKNEFGMSLPSIPRGATSWLIHLFAPRSLLRRVCPQPAGANRASRLLTSGLLGLALSVVLWGTGYKLSLYHPHPSPSVRVGVAKLWIGPQQRASAQRHACVRSAHTKGTKLLAAQTHFLCVQNRTSSYKAGVILEPSVVSALSVRFRLLLSTLRSPPAHYL
jgi:hypothetical protein